MNSILTTQQLEQYHRDGFIVLPKFASDEECLALRERALKLAKEHVPSPEQATIFTADSTAKHAADQYFCRVVTKSVASLKKTPLMNTARFATKRICA